MIACVLLPYFAASLTCRERKVPPDVPLILRAGEKVAATCEAAASRGVAFGMTIRQASWLCPDAQVLPIDFPALRRNIDTVVQVLSQFTHLIEAEKIPVNAKARTNPFPDARQSAVFYVDLERLAIDEAAQLAHDIGVTVRQAIAFEAGCGLATGKFTAYAAASHTSEGYIRLIRPDEEAAFLAPLPIWLLPMKKETGRRLHLLGIETLGAFANLPAGAAIAQCGKEGALLHKLAHGIDPRPVIPAILQVVERVTREFVVPVADRQIVEAILRSMANELSARLRSSGCMGETLALRLVLDGGETVDEKTTLRHPVSSSRFLTEGLLRLFARMTVPSGIGGLLATLADLVPFSGQQLELFPAQSKPRERLQQRLTSILVRPDAPDCFWVTAQDPMARRIEHRYRFEQVVPI
jgi:nucleotidyltransferase/DNA polymerase involved in DNA repair